MFSLSLVVGEEKALGKLRPRLSSNFSPLP
jgi:hypothetical protein